MIERGRQITCSYVVKQIARDLDYIRPRQSSAVQLGRFWMSARNYDSRQVLEVKRQCLVARLNTSGVETKRTQRHDKHPPLVKSARQHDGRVVYRKILSCKERSRCLYRAREICVAKWNVVGNKRDFCRQRSRPLVYSLCNHDRNVFTDARP